ncbi:response regulator [Flavobacterium sp.]|uniref:response regulator n=1 Tax=Flavobacterium sp. TaxID=239 RepID=UPI0039E4752B
MKNAILLFLLGTLFCIAQPTQKGATEKALETSKVLLEKLQYDSAYVYADKALWLANQSKDKKMQTRANLSVAEALYKQGKKVNGIPFAQKALQFAQQTADKEGITEAWLMLGNIHHSQYEDDQSIAYYQKIDAFCTKNKFENAALVKSIMATGLMFLRGYEDGSKPPMERAAEYFTRASEIAKRINLKTEGFIADSYLGAVLISGDHPDYDKAVALYKGGYEYFKQTGNIPQLSSILWAYATLYRNMKLYKVAEKYYLENIKINNIPGNLTGSARAHWQFAAYFYTTGQFKKAIPVYETAIRLFKMQQDPELGPLSACLFELSDSYAKTGNMKGAYLYLSQYKSIDDSLAVRQNKTEFADIESKYQSEKKAQQIKLLSVEKQLAEKQKNTQMIVFGAILLLMIVAAYVMYSAYKNRIRTAEKLREINDMKSKFFANISHEFRTPLTLIKSPLQTLEASKIDEDQRKQLALIDKHSDRMLELVNQLLELSKIDSGHFKLILKEGKLDDFLHSIIEPFAFQAKENDIQLIANIEKTTAMHHFDKDVIEKIATNLLSNAFKYTAQKQPVYFSGTIEKKELHLRISNSGTDLKKEDLPKLFERFYQKNETQNSSGIGLALVKELVELYNGSIETALDGQTLRFLIRLPLDQNNPNALKTETQEAVLAPEPQKPENKELPILLVVDDNVEIRQVIAGIFASEYKILEAPNGEKALKMAQKEIPDCIISDIMMPKMDGLAFTHALKNNELTSFIPLVLLTAKTSQETHLEALKSTADAFLTKPFNHEILKATVAQLIAERRKLQERYSQELVLKPVDIVINSVDEKFLDKLQKVLEIELPNSNFSTDDFAKELGMSRMQLHRKLKTLIGVSATEFLRNERLKAAAELLQKGNANISEIAYTVGFNDLSYFSKCFRERYQMTPTEYMEKS